MKIRYYVILITVTLLVALGGVHHFLMDDNNQVVDMTKFNDEREKICAKLSEDMGKREALQKKYACQIVFFTDDNYDEVSSNAIVDQKIVMDYKVGETIAGKIIFPGQQEKNRELFHDVEVQMRGVFLLLFLIFSSVFISMYLRYLRPFAKLQGFAHQITKGDLDVPLDMTRQNYFGAFTESFDIMREELKRARQGEYEANRSKKELVAGLSHDIKTPVSTIKALCEILMLQIRDEEALKKIRTINQKAGMIDTLITDMFHATLEELQALKTTPSEESSMEIRAMLEEINHYDKIHFENEIPECLVWIDKLRLNQVIDNVINNSYKYANTNIVVSFLEIPLDEESRLRGIKITLKDFGKGVSDEEVPLLTEKFYRGQNANSKTGSGLGLYLSKLFMEQMDGSFSCYCKEGFVVELIVLCV